MAMAHPSHESLVSDLIQNVPIRSASIQRAFWTVDRRIFVPGTELETEVYYDAPLRHGCVHMSAPHIYATVLEKLQLKPALSFLNIGSGSGYLAALVASILEEEGFVMNVELDEDTLEHSKKALKQFTRKIKKIQKEQKREFDRSFVEKVEEGEQMNEEQLLPLEEYVASDSERNDYDSNDENGNNNDIEVIENGDEFIQPLLVLLRHAVHRPARNLTKPRYMYPSIAPFEFIKADAFTLATTDPAGKFDRIYVGGGCSERDVKRFAPLLTIGGLLVGPFDDTLVLVERIDPEEKFAFSLISNGTLMAFSHSVIGRVSFAHLRRPKSIIQRVHLPRTALTLGITSCLAGLPPSFCKAFKTICILRKSAPLLSQLPKPLWRYIFTFLERSAFVPDLQPSLLFEHSMRHLHNGLFLDASILLQQCVCMCKLQAIHVSNTALCSKALASLTYCQYKLHLFSFANHYANDAFACGADCNDDARCYYKALSLLKMQTPRSNLNEAVQELRLVASSIEYREPNEQKAVMNALQYATKRAEEALENEGVSDHTEDDEYRAPGGIRRIHLLGLMQHLFAGDIEPMLHRVDDHRAAYDNDTPDDIED